VKRVIWIGHSRADLKKIPDKVRRAIGFALNLVEIGERPANSKILSGMGNAKVLEIRENDSSGTYRAVYTIEFQEYIFVLHVFQKKSKTGIATPKQEIDLIKQRLMNAKELYQQLVRGKNEKFNTK
jgi:phage-related protein